ncbi:MAG: acyl-CoA desaturase [Polyangiaceae bacterium]|nr:acyl-CoA desaturase [Polyangiaceae bacterium]
MLQPATPRAANARPTFQAGQVFNFVGIVLIHVGTLLALWRGVSFRLAALAAISYALRMFAITGVYHRYFSHRTYKTSRVFQFVLALWGTSATQKGPLWWASTHRLHHKHSDTERDVHSPTRRGFWYSHMGWWLGDEHVESRLDQIGDFARFPELRWLDRYHVVGVALVMGVAWLAGGFDGFLWGYVVSTCAVMHATFTINSLAHVFGSRRFATEDTSRNNALLALITFGEGWHNNHHHYQSSCRQGFYWWEVDLSYYAIKALERVGLVWDVREPPERVLAEGRRRTARRPAACSRAGLEGRR